jgi:hypothetical protein
MVSGQDQRPMIEEQVMHQGMLQLTIAAERARDMRDTAARGRLSRQARRERRASRKSRRVAQAGAPLAAARPACAADCHRPVMEH